MSSSLFTRACVVIATPATLIADEGPVGVLGVGRRGVGVASVVPAEPAAGQRQSAGRAANRTTRDGCDGILLRGFYCGSLALWGLRTAAPTSPRRYGGLGASIPFFKNRAIEIHLGGLIAG